MDYFWPVTILLCLLGLYLFTKESASIQFAFQQLAAKYNGNVKRGKINYPQLSFPHQDLIIKISAIPHENGAFAYLHFNTNKISEDCAFKIISKSMPIKYLEIDRQLKKPTIGIDKKSHGEQNKMII